MRSAFSTRFFGQEKDPAEFASTKRGGFQAIWMSNLAKLFCVCFLIRESCFRQMRKRKSRSYETGDLVEIQAVSYSDGELNRGSLTLQFDLVKTLSIRRSGGRLSSLFMSIRLCTDPLDLPDCVVRFDKRPVYLSNSYSPTLIPLSTQ